MQIGAVQIAVRTGEINIFHRAQRFASRFRIPFFPKPVPIKDQQFPRSDIADCFRPDDFKRTGLGSEDICIAQATHRERTESVRIRSDEQLVIGHEQKSKPAHQTLQGVFGSLNKILRRTRDQMRNDLRIAGRLEYGALHLQLAPKLRLIDDVAVRSNRQIALTIFKDERLRIRQSAVPAGRVTDMPDRHAALQRFQLVFIKHFFYKSHPAVIIEILAVGYADSCAFFAAVLEGVKPVIGKEAASGCPNTPNTPHSSFNVSKISL